MLFCANCAAITENLRHLAPMLTYFEDLCCHGDMVISVTPDAASCTKLGNTSPELTCGLVTLLYGDQYLMSVFIVA